MKVNTNIHCALSGFLTAVAVIVQLLPGGATQVQAEPAPHVLGASTVAFRGENRVNVSAQVNIQKPQQFLETNFDAIGAKSFLVYDAATGDVLASREPDLRLPIASLTKMMTAWVAYNRVSWSVPFVVPDMRITNVRPVVGLRPGETVTPGDLANAMFIGSANDAAEILASNVELTVQIPFIDLMNAEALRLGMTGSRFANPTGFDSPDNYSTAADIKILVDEVSKYTAFNLHGKAPGYDIVTELGRHRVAATHKLAMKDPEIYAVKTGYTSFARGAMVSRGGRDNHDIVVIVIGSADREGDTEGLKNEVFRAFVWK